MSAELQAEGRADVWVRFAERPDLSQFTTIADWNQRGQAVVDALQGAAGSSQGTLRASLDAQGADYEAFWATNSIRVSGADTDLVNSMALAAGVEGIYPTTEIEIPEIVPTTPEKAPAAIEWGVEDINAPAVWADGYEGQDIVVASIDTGAQWDHPALINQYRGNLGNGEVDHNYSWFDHAGTNPAPVDGNGHGSHVTGTMVGTDGGDNQIGVAPGAKWIAANGCCPSDDALYASGQWMLAPTDLNGENPDVSKRPHIINNSWGTTLPSNDPFMVDIIEAWAAAGQFGVFANGNSGPACNTSGAPGSLEAAYSVGNYNISHVISSSSGRGAGENGVIKPNISAPGTAVRSSVPGNGYAAYNGTSMASPHVAGAVALVWSASPTLLGDVEATRDLLNGTAIDTANDQCGGTPENNNVFGEGRLDAQALVNDAPIDGGTLTGVVTDASDDSAIAGASVHVVGPMERSVTTNSEGAYNTALSAGDYDVTISAFGYESFTQSVTIETDETTTVNAALDAAESATVSGVVTDGSGYGFPLYARIAVNGTPEATYSDPETGEYSLDIPSGAAYTLSVQAQYPGYTTPSREVTVSGDTTEDFAVPVDAASCIAPGYEITTDGIWETFDGTTVPEGWSVRNNHDTSENVWRFDNYGNRGNLTGGEGGFAIANSDAYGSGTQTDTTLVSPSVDMSDFDAPSVTFNSDYYHLGASSGTVELSIDGGETWEDVQTWTTSQRGPREVTVELPDAAGESDVHVGFTYHAPGWHWWWQVDNVQVGARYCVPAGDGGYVVGNVYDNTDEGILGATVTNLDAPEESAVTTATPADDNLDDGFYWIFSDTMGENTFEASANNYETATQDVTVMDGDVVRADFTLGSGVIVVEPTEIESTQAPDEVVEHTLTVTNTGTGAAEVELMERDGGFIAPAGVGVDIEPTTLDVPTSFAAFAGDEAEVGTYAQDGFAPNDTWESLPNYPRIAMDNRMVTLDGAYYSLGGTTGTAAFADVNRYDADAGTWQAVAPMPQAVSAVNAEAVGDQIVVSGGWVASSTSTSTYVYDAGADTWTQAASAPTGVSASGTAVIDGLMYVVGGCSSADCTPMSNNAMAYDVASDTWETLANYPTAAAFNVCGAVDGQLVCSGGNPGSGGIASTYTYDPGTDSWESAAAAPTPHWAAGAATANGQLVVQGGVQGAGAGVVSNATYAFDGEAWTTLAPAQTPVYRGDISCGIGKVGGSTGGFTPVANAEQLPGWDDCVTSTDVEWLDLDPQTFTVAAGESVEVTVATDSTGLDLGTYSAGIRVRSNTPQSVEDIPVTMTVTDEDEPEPPVGVIEVDPTSVTHTVEFGGSESTDVAFSNTGDADAAVSLSHDADWLTVDPEAFTVEADDSVNAAFTTDAEGLDAGTYTTQVEVGTDTDQELESITVTMVVGEAPVPPVGVIEVDPTSVTHTVEFGGSESTDVAFSNTGDADAAVSLSHDDADWLTVDPEAFTVAADDSVNAAFVTDADGLDAGTYTTQVEVGTDTDQELESITVTMVVGEAPVPPVGVIEVDPTSVSHTVEFGGSESTDVVFSNTGEADAAVSLSHDDADWLTVDPEAFTVAADDSVNAAFTTDADGLDAGTYTTQVEVGTDTDQELESITVTMIVEAAEEPEPGFEVERWAGGNRYGTAAAVSSTYEAGVDVVFLATGLDYPDALTGSALAGSLDAPVLLTRFAQMPDPTVVELERLAPERVVVLGGSDAISDAVLAQVMAVTGVQAERISGTNRYGTAAAVAAEFGSSDRVFVATGVDYPDALSAAARAGALDSPVLLVRRTEIPSATAAALDALDPAQITVLGAEGAVDQSVVNQLRQWAPTSRTGGLNRYATSVRIFADVLSAETVYLASGQNWPDALAGSAKAGSDHEPLLITRKNALPGPIGGALVRLFPDKVVVLGGEDAITQKVVDELEELLGD